MFPHGLTGRRRLPAALLALTLVLAAGPAGADEAAGTQPYGSLFRALAGDTLERRYGIAVIGLGHVTFAQANRDIASALLPQGRGRNVQPQGGLVQDEGLNLNQVGVEICRGAGCPLGRPFDAAPGRTVVGRVTPLPGPRGDRVQVDFNVSVLYGEDLFFWKTKGFDDWAWDADDKHKLGVTQWFLDLFLPVWEGVSLMLGSWHSPLANEIGYPFDPPNWFSSRTYAFAVGPAKHVGALAQARLPLDERFGLASVGLGLVPGWNTIELGSGSKEPTLLFTTRWRSSDFRTWVDFEAIYGNGEDDFGDTTLVEGVPRPLGGGTQFLALSSKDAFLGRFVGFLSLVHTLDARTSLAVESVYGFQEGGDLAPVPFAITRDSEFYGVNAALRYRLGPSLHAGVRAEWLRDEHAASVQWSGVGAGGGDVYALTLNLGWTPVPHVLVRPELKLDMYDGAGHLFAPGDDGRARRDSQLLAVLNLEFRF